MVVLIEYLPLIDLVLIVKSCDLFAKFNWFYANDSIELISVN